MYTKVCSSSPFGIKNLEDFGKKIKEGTPTAKQTSDTDKQIEFNNLTIALDKVNEQLEIVSNEFTRFEKIIRENNTKGNFEILLKIQGLLNEIK